MQYLGSLNSLVELRQQLDAFTGYESFIFRYCGKITIYQSQQQQQKGTSHQIVVVSTIIYLTP